MVSIHYTLTDDQNKTLDTSAGGEPLIYIQGMGHIIPGLEKALEGKTKGTKFKISINPEDAYGIRNNQMIQTVPKTEFQDASKISVGMQFQVETDHAPMVLTVIEVKDQDIVLDGNHPLAGMKLHFDVEVVDLRNATAEELSHGHAHGPDGHHHH